LRLKGWKIRATDIFNKLYGDLVKSVFSLSKKHPEAYRVHPRTKLLASIQKAIKENVPSDPGHKNFRLGNTIGKKYSHWRRVKHQMPPRYRMFFRFHSNYTQSHDSSPFKCIIFAWFNDETTLRKNGSKSDVYEVFRSLLVKKRFQTIGQIYCNQQKR